MYVKTHCFGDLPPERMQDRKEGELEGIEGNLNENRFPRDLLPLGLSDKILKLFLCSPILISIFKI